MVDFSKRTTAIASAAINEILGAALDAALVAKTKAEYEATRGSGDGEVAKKRIGAGYIGTECARELAFRFHKHPKEEREGPVSKGELQRHAEAGHWTEAKTADWFQLIGLEVETYQRDKETGLPLLDAFGKPKQIGWKAARDPATGQYRMAGEVDGVVVGFSQSRYVLPATLAEITAHIKTPCIWESKKATDKKWKKFSKDTVKRADPRYYGQLQTNMAYMGVEQTLFSMLNLDNMKYYFELVPFDLAYAQDLSDRGVKVLQSENAFELPRLCRTDDDFNGKFCDFHGQCWRGLVLNKPEPAPQTTQNVCPVHNISFVASCGLCGADKRPVFNPNFKI